MVNELARHDELTDGIKRLAAQQRDNGPQPYAGQKEHDLLLHSVDHVAQDWVRELQHVRKNNEQVEALVLAGAAQVKNHITKLFLLLNAARTEAQRGDAVNHKLAEELQAMIEEGRPDDDSAH